MGTIISEFDLQVRYQIYHFFVNHCVAPSYQQIANSLNAENENVRVSFHKLHERHMIFLERNSDSIRMANPFSAIPTKFKVISGNKQWWANCAWDSLVPYELDPCTKSKELGMQSSGLSEGRNDDHLA